MAAISSASNYQVSPNQGEVLNLYICSGNDGDTVDLSSTTVVSKYTLSSIRSVEAKSATTGLAVKATFSGTTVTIAAGGSATSQTYHLWVIGHA